MHLILTIAAGLIVCLIGVAFLMAYSSKEEPESKDDETDFYHKEVTLISRKRKTA